MELIQNNLVKTFRDSIEFCLPRTSLLYRVGGINYLNHSNDHLVPDASTVDS